MKKFAKYSIIIIAIFYWAISHFEGLYQWAGKNKIYPDDYRYGDLYRLSFLQKFKEATPICEAKNSKEGQKNKVKLFLIGDSFAEEGKINKDNFEVSDYQYIHWDKNAEVQLKSDVKNVLILECVERSIKMHFTKISDEIKLKVPKENAIKENENSLSEYFQNLINVFSHNTAKTEERLWHTLLNYDIILKIKELKAEIDQKFFDRKLPNYNLSAEKNEIFYFEEAAVNSPHSAFYPVKDSEIDQFVAIINNDLAKYKAMGFDEVYLSIIPNKVSILAPNMGTYNHVLERIQNHKILKIKIIDTYSIFKNDPKNIFSKSDTHWNCNGSGIWQNLVNQKLKKIL